MERLVRTLALLATGLTVACGGDTVRSLEQLPGEAQVHASTMDDIMRRMSEHMGGMAHCSGGGRSRIVAVTGQMDVEMEMQRAALDSASNLEAARSSCAEHMDVMSDMLDAMADSIPRRLVPGYVMTLSWRPR